MPSVDKKDFYPSDRIQIHKVPSMTLKKVKSIQKSKRSLAYVSPFRQKKRKSVAQRSPPKLEYLLSIVDDNKRMYKRYLVDRV